MKNNILIIALFIILIIVTTFPLFLNINSSIPGFISSDESYAALWNHWRIKYSLLNHSSLFYTDLVAFPFGINIYRSKVISYLWLLYTHLLSIITNPIFTYNFQIIINTLLSALFVYLLVYKIAGNRFIGFFSGLIFAFSPYQFARAWQHLTLTYNQWLVLPLFMAISLKDNPSRKNKVIFLLSLLLLASFDFSITYIGAIALLIFFFYQAFNKADSKYLKRLIVISIVAGIISLPQFLPIILNLLGPSHMAPSAHNPFHRAFGDLFEQSARPLSYFLPACAHPVFGKFTETFIGTSLYGMSLTEHTLYLGWIPLILAFVAVRRWGRVRKDTQGQSPAGTVPFNNEYFYIGFFLFLALVAWFFSQPPWWSIFGFKLYMPSFFMYKILPMFRAYCRFGILVMFAIAVLAGFGLKFLLERLKTQKTKNAVTVLFCALVLFEFWNYPPFKVIDVSRVPEVYYWLKKEPKDTVIAEYPLDTNGANDLYKFYQTKHEKKLINGTVPGTYPNRISASMTKLSEIPTTEILKWMGVKYVLVHEEDYLNSGLTEDRDEFERIAKNTGLKFIRNFPAEECPQKDSICTKESGPIHVYEVVAKAKMPGV